MHLKKIAFIPARSGSKRVANKNILPLNGHPILAYTIRAAIDSKSFDKVVCITDSKEYADIAKYYGAEVPLLRPKKNAQDKSPDIDWLIWITEFFTKKKDNFDIFSILRPTNPLRLSSTINRAMKKFLSSKNIDSLRAIEKANPHPGKMWVVRNDRMFPILPYLREDTPWHSTQYAGLPEVYQQDASLEIGWVKIVKKYKSISGHTIVPFYSTGYEGKDINDINDLMYIRFLVEKNLAILPDINIKPYDLKQLNLEK